MSYQKRVGRRTYEENCGVLEKREHKAQIKEEMILEQLRLKTMKKEYQEFLLNMDKMVEEFGDWYDSLYRYKCYDLASGLTFKEYLEVFNCGPNPAPARSAKINILRRFFACN